MFLQQAKDMNATLQDLDPDWTDPQLVGMMAISAALIAVAERLDILIENQQTAPSDDDILDNFTEHARPIPGSLPYPYGDDWPRQ